MNEHDFIPGQRWISDTEPELGLGLVIGADLRTVNLHFPAVDESRVYARADAPLTRVRFSRHDHIEDLDGNRLRVENVIEHDGLLRYEGADSAGRTIALDETRLNHAMKLNKPRDRLFNLQLDKNSAFELRYRTLQHLHELLPSPVRGLGGARVSLVPHQLFIARELGSRPAPRALLADEVGLGKTIEAGLILHRQWLSGRARRILIMVPESLLHQWLVEMLRRFNLRFCLFDEARCAALEQETGNPFHAEQLVLCSQDFLRNNPARQPQLLAGNWDMLVVDEAHHLQWQPDRPSPEYALVEALGKVTPGVLLLTATPEQLGAEGHFARLRLLDPERFFSLEEFLAEESLYAPIARAAGELQDHGRLNEENRRLLQQALADSPRGLALLERLDNDEARGETAEALLRLLRDRHGTGRILFRNTRKAISGFPERRLQRFALQAEPGYLQTLLEAGRHTDNGQWLLSPERLYQQHKAAAAPDWFRLDPRVDWLHRTLRELKGSKVLVIAAEAQTVLELAAALRQRHGLHAAVFHEGMSILERDRAAAWFADPEEGSPLLLCSEIGSEGRNFQFAHHLILFDLPLHPDLLEQRIGRLDRIGQTQTVQILTPFIEGSAQALMLDWYDQGLDAFSQTCPAGAGVYREVEQELLACLRQPANARARQALLQRSRQRYEALSARLQEGRDRLLELNSFRAEQASEIVRQLAATDADPACAEYLQQAFDTFGVDFEARDANSFVARPGEHMLVHRFPELPGEGLTLTFSREHALAHEDQQFMTWEHPMLTGVMDLVLSSETGNASLVICKHPGLATGEMLLECLFRLEGSAPRQLQIDRFLPPQLIRLLLDSKLRERGQQISFDELQVLPAELDAHTRKQIIDSQQDRLRQMIEHAESLAEEQLPAIIDRHRQRMQQQLGDEIQRLRELRQINPNVRDEEITFPEKQREELDRCMQQAVLRLDALRLILAA